MRISLTNGRGKYFAAEIIGRHPKYKLARRFLTLAENGKRLNCYVGYTSVEELAVGSIVETCSADYKGHQTREFMRVTESGLVEMSQLDVMTAVADMPVVEG